MAERNRIAIVTGGGTGIGRAAALAMLKDGYTVVVAGRRKEPLEQVIAAAGDDADRAMAILM